MKKSGKFKLFGVLIFLSVALVFMGGNFLESVVPEWWVTIPTLENANGQGYNLYGTNGGVYYDDSTYVLAGGNRGRRKHPDYPYHVFELTLCNTNSWGDPCTEEGEYYGPGNYTVGFQNINLTNVVYTLEGSTCFFPPMTDITSEPDHPSCYGLGAPFCMECFLNNTVHPSSWVCVDGENRGYMGAYIKMKVFDEIWNYPIMGQPKIAPISLYLSVYTGRLMQGAGDFYHDLEIHIPKEKNYMAYVTRLNTNGWNIVSITPTESGLVEFRETYKELVGELIPRGKSGNYKYEYEKHTTMIATADHFSFNISWEKY